MASLHSVRVACFDLEVCVVSLQEIDLTPPPTMYRTFERVDYKPWEAIAEFVDNSTQSFFSNRDQLDRHATGDAARLHVAIEYDEDGPDGPILRIRDDAAGIVGQDLDRALTPSAPPPDRSGRCEYGMGMKAAACWFASRWTLSTTALGDPVRRSVTVDLDELDAEGAKVKVLEEPEETQAHGTVLELKPLRKPIRTKTVSKIKQLLSSMYRYDIERKDICITWRGAELRYEWPKLWVDEHSDGTSTEWCKPIDLVVHDPSDGTDHEVRGWVGLLATMSSGENNGFGILRRGRVVRGGPSKNWKPAALLGSHGSHSWKRLTGELFVDSFPVTIDKTDFRWEDGLEDALIEALKPHVADYRRAAADMRVRAGAATSTSISPQDVRAIGEPIRRGLHEHAEHVEALDEVAATAPPSPEHGSQEAKDLGERLSESTIASATIEIPGERSARLELRDGDPTGRWVDITVPNDQEILVYLNTGHAVFTEHQDSEKALGLLARVALAFGHAEVQARRLSNGEGRVKPDQIRTSLTSFLQYTIATS